MSTASSPKITCPHCQGTMKSAGLAAGSKVNCPKCGKPFVLGGAPQPAARVPPQPVPSPRPSAPDPAPQAAVPPATVFPTAVPKPFYPKQTPPAAPVAPVQATNPRPAPLSKPLGPLDAIPADVLSAAMATQPAHRPPKEDTLVDPNLLPPPPPKPKPKPTSITVVCRLCGTRMGAPLEKAGLTIQCPDCHTVNEIKAPEPPKEPRKPAGPTLDDVPEFAMSEVVERPKYKPLVVARGEDAVLGDLPGADHPPGWTPPVPPAPPVAAAPAAAEPIAGAPMAAPVMQGTLTFDPPAHEVDEEITLEAPVERLEVKPELPKAYLEPDPVEEKLIDGRYDKDDLIGAGGVNPKSPEAWKKAPFLLGLFDFLMYPQTAARWVMYGLGAGGVLILLHTAISLTMSSGLGEQLAAIFVDGAAGLAIGLWLAPFAASLLAIMEDTANGCSEVENFPDWNVFDWFLRAFLVVAAAFVSGLPGIFAAIVLVTGGGPPVAAPLPVVVCWAMFFPVVMYSMLAENSVTAIYSQRTGRSFQFASEAWLLFYLYSLGLGLLGGAMAALAAWPNFVALLIGGFGLVTVAFLYSRLLGRLMWYCDQKELKLGQQAARPIAS